LGVIVENDSWFAGAKLFDAEPKQQRDMQQRDMQQNAGTKSDSHRGLSPCSTVSIPSAAKLKARWNAGIVFSITLGVVEPRCANIFIDGLGDSFS
jgi:hypothetical protein